MILDPWGAFSYKRLRISDIDYNDVLIWKRLTHANKYTNTKTLSFPLIISTPFLNCASKTGQKSIRACPLNNSNVDIFKFLFRSTVYYGSRWNKQRTLKRIMFLQLFIFSSVLNNYDCVVVFVVVFPCGII